MDRAIYLTEEEFKLNLWWAFLAGSVTDPRKLVSTSFYEWYDEYTKDYTDLSGSNNDNSQ